MQTLNHIYCLRRYTKLQFWVSVDVHDPTRTATEGVLQRSGKLFRKNRLTVQKPALFVIDSQNQRRNQLVHPPFSKASVGSEHDDSAGAAESDREEPCRTS